MFVRKLTPRQAHVGENPYKTIFMMARNVTLELTNDRDEPYAKTNHADEKPYTWTF